MCVWPTHTRLERHAHNRRGSKPWSRGRGSRPGWCAAPVSFSGARGRSGRGRRVAARPVAGGGIADRGRFAREGVDGLRERPKAGRRDHAVPAETVEEIVQRALSPPPAGRSRWTTRLLGQVVGLTSGCVSDVLRAHGIKPHLTRTYKVSQDPAFAAKVTDVVGLYLHPPEHAIVLSVDEKTSIQALERTQPPLPLRAGRAVRHTHDYRRHGIVDLFAALEVATGTVTHRFSASHTAADFLRCMKKVVRTYPGRQLMSFSTTLRRTIRRTCAPGSPPTRASTSTTPQRARPG